MSDLRTREQIANEFRKIIKSDLSEPMERINALSKLAEILGLKKAPEESSWRDMSQEKLEEYLVASFSEILDEYSGKLLAPAEPGGVVNQEDRFSPPDAE